jgi:hypothetical protein
MPRIRVPRIPVLAGSLLLVQSTFPETTAETTEKQNSAAGDWNTYTRGLVL